MSKHFFDFEDGDFAFSISDNMAMDSDGNNEKHLRILENKLIELLSASEVRFIQNGGTNTLPGVLSLAFPGKEGEAILHRMDLMGISISTGSACDSKNTEISHVLQAIRLDEELATGTIRISLGKNNSESDAEAIAAALIKIAK